MTHWEEFSKICPLVAKGLREITEKELGRECTEEELCERYGVDGVFDDSDVEALEELNDTEVELRKIVRNAEELVERALGKGENK